MNAAYRDSWVLSGSEVVLLEELGLPAPDRTIFGLALSDDAFVGELSSKDSYAAISRLRSRMIGSEALALATVDFGYRVCGIRDQGLLSELLNSKKSKRDMVSALQRVGVANLRRVSITSMPSGPTDRVDTNISIQMVGAIMLCYGYNRTFNFLTKIGYLTRPDMPSLLLTNHKTRLQNFVQGKWHCRPDYRVVRSEGPGDAKVFWVEVHVHDRCCIGWGQSKKAAEDDAAAKMLSLLDAPIISPKTQPDCEQARLTPGRLAELHKVTDRLGLAMRRPELFDAALTHPSARAENGPRLETYGPLATVGSWLWRTCSAWSIADPESFSRLGEGDFATYSKKLLGYLCDNSFVMKAWEVFELDDYVRMSPPQRLDGLQSKSKSNLAQALLAACFYNIREIDKVGYFPLTHQHFVDSFLRGDVASLTQSALRCSDPKTQLQTCLQALGMSARYRLMESEKVTGCQEYHHSIELSILNNAGRLLETFFFKAIGQRQWAERGCATQAIEWLKDLCLFDSRKVDGARDDLLRFVCKSASQSYARGNLDCSVASTLFGYSGLRALSDNDFPAVYRQLVNVYDRLMVRFPDISADWVVGIYKYAVVGFRRKLGVWNLSDVVGELSSAHAVLKETSSANHRLGETTSVILDFLSYVKCFKHANATNVDVNRLLETIAPLHRRKGSLRLDLGAIREIRALHDLLLMTIHGIMKECVDAAVGGVVSIKTFTETRDKEARVVFRYESDSDRPVPLKRYRDELAINLGRVEVEQTARGVQITVSLLYATGEAIYGSGDGRTLFKHIQEEVMARRLRPRDAAERMASTTIAVFQNSLLESCADLTAVAAVVHDVKNGLLTLGALSSLDDDPEHIRQRSALSDYLEQRVAALQRYAIVNISIRKIRIHVRQWFDRALDVIVPMVPDGISLSVETDELCGDIVADPDLLVSPLVTLVKNAIEAMPSGGSLTITALVDNSSRNLVIEVADSGCGIPDDIEGSLLHEAVSSKADVGGTGLGLLTAKRILEAHDGLIWLASSRIGVTFVCEIPLVIVNTDISESKD